MKKKLKRYFFLTIGFISVILGTIGAFLPVIPTVPFLLLALFCFSKSSKKAYHFIVNNRYFGKTLKDYYDGKGLTIAIKLKAILFLTIGIAFSIYNFKNLHVRILLLVIWLGVTIHLALLKNKNN